MQSMTCHQTGFPPSGVVCTSPIKSVDLLRMVVIHTHCMSLAKADKLTVRVTAQDKQCHSEVRIGMVIIITGMSMTRIEPGVSWN